MRTVCAVIVVLALSFGVAVQAFGSATDWCINMRVRQGTVPGAISTFGTQPGALVGVGPEDASAPIGSGYPYIASNVGISWLIKDIRPPLEPGQTQTWTLRIFPIPQDMSPCVLYVWNPVSADYEGSFPLQIWQGQELLYTIDPSANGTSSQPCFIKTFDTSGLEMLQLRMTAGPMIPEPASACALLAGVCGIALTRRRRG